MSNYTTLGLGGPADIMFEPADEADLKAALAIVRKRKVPLKVIGGGSNLLVGDRGVRGIIVRLPPDLISTEMVGQDEGVWVSYCAGMLSVAAYRHAIENRLVGLEFLPGIPGTIGGALRMNAGGRLGEMADVVEGIEVMRVDGATYIPAQELGFAYRYAELPDSAVITRVDVLLRPAESREITSVKERVQQEIEHRRLTQPAGRSAGSMFKNPPGRHAARLLEDCGLKGESVGGARVSTEHANFLINDGTATAGDMMQLIDLCRNKVRKQFGLSLELEVKLEGEF